MMINKKYFIISAFMLLLLSCGDRDADIPLDNMSGRIVIEGNISDQNGQSFVAVSRTVKISSGDDEYSPVANAIVTVSDSQGHVDTLKYENGVYKPVNLVSNYREIYTLSVTVDGVTYKATSKMPEYVNLDDVKQSKIFDGFNNVSGLIPIFTDPAAKGNYYLFKSKLKDDDNNDTSYTVMSDEIGNGEVNGKPISIDVQYGVNQYVTVELQCIDASVYNYFKAFPQAVLHNSGATITPTNPPSNISNGALGYFSAHTSSSKTITIQE